jgi:RNA polymerase sigma-70 factor (ECF subfamily)
MPSADSDSELLARYQHDRDPAAFEQLFGRHKNALLRYILRIVGDRATAEDASQRTWLKVIEAVNKGAYTARREAAFRTWLFTLAKNLVVDEQRRKQASVRVASRAEAADTALLVVGASADSASTDPADQAMESDLAERINSALRLLPSAQREVLTLWAAGFDPQEIAVMTRVPRETVLSRKKYALAKLRASAFVDVC